MRYKTISIEQVKNSKCYKALGFIQQKMMTNRNNMIVLNNGINIAKNRGIKILIQEHNYSFNNIQLIKELI